MLRLAFLSVYLSRVSNRIVTEKDRREVYGDYPGQVVEKSFMGEDDIKSANAIISYDKTLDWYSIELSLTTEKETNEEKIELYKYALRKTYVEVTLMINGEIR